MKILFNCLQKLTSIKGISGAARDWQMKGTEQLNDMNKVINFINEKFEEYKKALKEKDEEIKLLEKVKNYLNKRIDKMDAVVAKQEQYSRRNCLLVEETTEDTDKKIKRLSAHYNKA